VGFSPWGLLVAAAVLAPNLLIARWPPRAPLPAVRVAGPLRWMERAGQASCIVVPVITRTGELSWWWAVPTLVALAAYYGLWARYLVTGRDAAELYRSWCFVPVPMAVLPVLVFLGAAAWLGNPWVALAAMVLAAGHIPGSVIIARAVNAGS
jgi:hypothetical protein